MGCGNTVQSSRTVAIDARMRLAKTERINPCLRLCGAPSGAAYSPQEPQRSPKKTLASPVRRGQFCLNSLESWCREGGSNPHDRKGRRILSPLRLPVPPSRRSISTALESKAYPKTFRSGKHKLATCMPKLPMEPFQYRTTTAPRPVG